MKDCAGGQHPDDEPVTWRQFDREMAHRAENQRIKEDAMQKAIDLRAAQMLTSHRIIVVVISAIAIAFQVLVFFRR